MNSDQQQTCKVCRRPDCFNFHVPDDVWARVVPSRYRHLVVCLPCFDSFAKAQGVNYAPELSEIYFAGEQTTMKLKVEWSRP